MVFLMRAAEVFRDFVTGGVPSSGKWQPKKSDIRAWGEWIEGVIGAFFSTGGKIYQTRALLNSDLTPTANSIAWVMEDPTVTNNGIYRKVGATNAGSWVRAGDLPFSFVVASNPGAGAPNAIHATTSMPVSSSALVILPVAETNTASPVTVSFNGGSALTVKTNSDNDVSAGGLVAGMLLLGIVSGAKFRLVNDQVSSAIVAAAESASASAIAARDTALAAAAGVSLPIVAPNRMLVDNPTGTARESKTFAQVADLLSVPLDSYYRTRKSIHEFGSCGAGNVSDDTAAFTAALAWCKQNDTILTFQSGKTYTLNFQFMVNLQAPRMKVPDFVVEAWGATIKYTGAGSGFRYRGSYSGSSSGYREFAGVRGGNFITDGAGTHYIFHMRLAYIGSSQYKEAEFIGVTANVSDVNDPTKYWAGGFFRYNVWNALIAYNTLNQSIGKYASSAIEGAGLSPAAKAFGNNFQWWAVGAYEGFEQLVGLKGVKGGGLDLQYGELVMGATSGAIGYVAQVVPIGNNLLTTNMGLGTRYDLGVEAISGTFVNGEVVTGQTSGRTLTMNAAPGALILPCEGLYLVGNDFVLCSYGFFCSVPDAACRPYVGLETAANHTNTMISSFVLTNCYQATIGPGLNYAAAANWIGVNMNKASQTTISSDAQFNGLGMANAVGVSIDNTSEHRINAKALYCSVGVSVGGGAVVGHFGMAFTNCTDEIVNFAPVLPTANGNSWWATPGTQDNWLQGYNK